MDWLFPDSGLLYLLRFEASFLVLRLPLTVWTKDVGNMGGGGEDCTFVLEESLQQQQSLWQHWRANPSVMLYANDFYNHFTSQDDVCSLEDWGQQIQHGHLLLDISGPSLCVGHQILRWNQISETFWIFLTFSLAAWIQRKWVSVLKNFTASQVFDHFSCCQE